MQITDKEIGISLSKSICIETFKENLIRDKHLTQEEVQEIRSQTIVLYLNGDYFPDPEVARYLFSQRAYPKDPKDILLSGWALGKEKIAGKAALVEVKIGKGKIILFGFRPQYRGQSIATFPLLFNSIAR